MPAAAGAQIQPADRPAPAPAAPPAPKQPTVWQSFLLFIRSILAWWIDVIDRHLAA